MPLSSELEALCQRLEMGEPEPSAAALIRQQAREIDELWDRLSRASVDPPVAVRVLHPSEAGVNELADAVHNVARVVNNRKAQAREEGHDRSTRGPAGE